MLYHDERYNLTLQEQEHALRKARLPEDPQQWNAEDYDQAEIILAMAQRRKIARLAIATRKASRGL